MKEQKQDKTRSWLLVLVPICIVLFLISSFMLGTLLYNMATRDTHAIDMEVGTHGELELFKISYEDETGNVVVEGANGEDVVAPGTEVTYTVRLENHDNIAIDYLLTCTSEFYNAHEIPIEIQLKDSHGNYLLGGENKWVSVLELNNLVHRGTIQKDEFDSFDFSWRWGFETGDPATDEYDTFLGNLEGEDVPGIRIAFHTDSMVSEDLQGHAILFHKHDYGCCICCILVWVLLIICLIQLAFMWKLRKDLKEEKEKNSTLTAATITNE